MLHLLYRSTRFSSWIISRLQPIILRGKLTTIISLLRNTDLKAKGVDSSGTSFPDGELMKELIFQNNCIKITKDHASHRFPLIANFFRRERRNKSSR